MLRFLFVILRSFWLFIYVYKVYFSTHMHTRALCSLDLPFVLLTNGKHVKSLHVLIVNVRGHGDMATVIVVCQRQQWSEHEQRYCKQNGQRGWGNLVKNYDSIVNMMLYGTVSRSAFCGCHSSTHRDLHNDGRDVTMN